MSDRKISIPAMPQTDAPAAWDAWFAEAERIEREAVERAREREGNPFEDDAR